MDPPRVPRCLEREVSAHQTNGGELRIKAARLPTRKTIKDFDFTLQRSLKQNTVLHLGVLPRDVVDT